jgi:hypothetical protein
VKVFTEGRCVNSGMRIGDCVGLQKTHLKDDKLFLNTQKSGGKIHGCATLFPPRTPAVGLLIWAARRPESVLTDGRPRQA